jgi:tetratricopeptide (TPR) repeat protein
MEALEAFETSISLDPKDLKTYRERAITLRALGREEEALADEAKASELDNPQ